MRYPTAGIAVCTAVGEVDLATAPLLCDRLHEAIGNEPRCLVVDLSDVTFFSAAGVGALQAARAAQAGHQQLVLVANARPVVRVLDVCEVSYPRYRDLNGALAACDDTTPP